jgi:hypothetical protein
LIATENPNCPIFVVAIEKADMPLAAFQTFAPEHRKIAALRIGESLSFSTRWPTWQKPATPNIITESRRRLKNGVAPHVMRAKTRSGGTFTVDTTVSLSHDYSHIIVAVIITRLTARARSK